MWRSLGVTGLSSGAVLPVSGTLMEALSLSALLSLVARLRGPPCCRRGVLLVVWGGSSQRSGRLPVPCELPSLGVPSEGLRLPGCHGPCLACPVQGERSVLDVAPPPLLRSAWARRMVGSLLRLARPSALKLCCPVAMGGLEALPSSAPSCLRSSLLSSAQAWLFTGRLGCCPGAGGGDSLCFPRALGAVA